MKRLALASLIAAIAAACSDRTPPAAAPRAPSGDAACASCHAAIVEEHRASLHRASFTDGTFQASLALEEPKEHAFCIGCHAPAKDRAAGVDCASCHGTAPHEVRRQATCAGCHEFAFDGRPELVQKTLTEHAASDYAAVACADCHLPARDGHRDHRFLAGHAPERIARAVHVDVSRAGDATVRVAIRVDAGHAFPTGDMFRRARLLVFGEGADGAIVASAERTFGRTWTGLRDGPNAGARTEASDTRIRGSWTEDVALDEVSSPAPPIVRVRWSLVFERVVAMRPPHITLASSDVLREGELSW